MTRKATTKKPKAAKASKPKASKAKPTKAGKKTPAKKPQKPAKPRAVPAYVVVRDLTRESPTFSEPDRVFATKGAALKFAEERNRELRQLVNPFDGRSAAYSLKGGEKALIALLKKLRLPIPKKDKSYIFIDWEEWWDQRYFDVTDAQREAIWNALDKYNWYTVKTTTVE
jgi:hypothetical protein